MKGLKQAYSHQATIASLRSKIRSLETSNTKLTSSNLALTAKGLADREAVAMLKDKVKEAEKSLKGDGCALRELLVASKIEIIGRISTLSEEFKTFSNIPMQVTTTTTPNQLPQIVGRVPLPMQPINPMQTRPPFQQLTGPFLPNPQYSGAYIDRGSTPPFGTIYFFQLLSLILRLQDAHLHHFRLCPVWCLQQNLHLTTF